MTIIDITDREDASHRLVAADGGTLMEVLRAAELGIAGTCGGICSCGTCHVYLDSASAKRLPPPGEEERDMLDALADIVEVRAESRLSCQIRLEAGCGGLRLTIAPQM